MPHECTTCGRKFDDGSKEMLSGCPNCGGNKFQFQPAGRGSGAADAPEGKQSPTADAEPSTDLDATADAEPPADADPSTSIDATADVEREMPELSKDHDAAGADAASAGTGAGADTPADGTAGTADTPGDGTPGTDDPAGATARSGFDDEFEDAEIADDVAAEDTAQNDARTSQATLDDISEARRKMEAAAEEQLSDADEKDGERGRGTPQGPPRDPPSSEEAEAFDISGAVGPEDGDPVEKQPVGGSTGEPAEPVTDADSDLSALREELNDQFESIKITAPGQYELNLMELYDRKEYIISLQEDGRYVIEMADDYGIDED